MSVGSSMKRVPLSVSMSTGGEDIAVDVSPIRKEMAALPIEDVYPVVFCPKVSSHGIRLATSFVIASKKHSW